MSLKTFVPVSLFESQLNSIKSYFSSFQADELTESDLEMIAGNLGAANSMCGGGCCSCGMTTTR